MNDLLNLICLNLDLLYILQVLYRVLRALLSTETDFRALHSVNVYQWLLVLLKFGYRVVSIKHF